MRGGEDEGGLVGMEWWLDGSRQMGSGLRVSRLKNVLTVSVLVEAIAMAK